MGPKLTAVGELTAPALVHISQGGSGGGKGFGGIDWCLDGRAFIVHHRAVIRLGFLQERIFLQFLLNKGGELKV